MADCFILRKNNIIKSEYGDEYIKNGLILFSNLNDQLIFNSNYNDKLNNYVNYCDGTNGYANFSKPDIVSQLSTSFTIQVLAYTTMSNAFGEIFGIIYDSPNQAITIGVNGSGYFTSSIAGGKALDTPAIINNGKWHLLAITYSDSIAKFYVDGIKVIQHSVAINIPRNADIYIGSWKSNISKFKGLCTNGCIYNRALSEEEILQNYQKDVKQYNIK